LKLKERTGTLRERERVGDNEKVTDIYTVKRKDNVTNGDMKDLDVNKEKDVYESKRVRLTKERKEREIEREICSDTHTHTHVYIRERVRERERV